MMIALLWILALAALLLSWSQGRQRTRQALVLAGRSLGKLALPLLLMVAAVGLALALLPPQVIGQLFKLHGATGFLLISLVGALVTIPAPVAFALAGSLLEMGASPAALAAFITTVTMVGVVTAPLEAAHFGRRFTLIRQTLSLAMALTVGLAMGEVL